VGESAVSRKTTAQRFAIDILQATSDKINILGSLSSAEGLLRTLGAYCPDEEEFRISRCTIANLEEFSSLLRKSRQEAISNLMPMLTEVYDLPSQLTLPRVRRPLRVDRPFLSILAGTTPEWLESSIRLEEIAGGFCNRFLYCAGTPKEAIPSPESPNKALLQEISDELREVLDFWGESNDKVLKLTEEAEMVWADFYSKWRRKIESDQTTQILTERIPEYARKIALVSAALAKSDCIDSDNLLVGLATAEYAEQSLRRVFGSIALGGPVDRCEKRILQVLGENNPLTRRELQMNCSSYGSAEIFRRAISALLFAQRIYEQTDEKGKVWIHKTR